MDNDQKLKVVSQLARHLNEEHIVWAVGASLLLYLKGIVTQFTDIDIMVSEDDVKRLDLILQRAGAQLKPTRDKSPLYKTKYFVEYSFEGVDIDVMAGFTIVKDCVDHYFPLKQEDVHEVFELYGEKVPLQSLQAWKTYYALMGRSESVSKIEEWLQRKGQTC